MYKVKHSEILIVAFLSAILLCFAVNADGAESSVQEGFKSYKFHTLKDKISSLSVWSSQDSDETAILSNKTTADATNENLIINNADGVKVIKNNPEKAGFQVENNQGSNSGKPSFFVENRIRWEENGYRMNGGKNVNNSAVMNRTRVNIKINLDEKNSDDLSSQKTNNFRTGTKSEK